MWGVELSTARTGICFLCWAKLCLIVLPDDKDFFLKPPKYNFYLFWFSNCSREIYERFVTIWALRVLHILVQKIKSKKRKKGKKILVRVGIELMTLMSLVCCSTIWATGDQLANEAKKPFIFSTQDCVVTKFFIL